MKQKLILVIALISGVAAFWLTGQYLKRERDRIRKSVVMETVVAARKVLPAGTVLQESDLGLIDVPKGSVSSRAVQRHEYKQILNKKLLYSIPQGAALLWSDIDAPRPGESGLADTIRTELRAISISVDAVSSVSGLVRPNDRVDILGTFTFPTPEGEMEVVTMTVLQDVSVLATGQQMGKEDSGQRQAANRGYGTVTFEVSPKEAEMLVFAQAVKGRLTLTLRNPEDISFEEDLPQVNFEHIKNNIETLNNERQINIRRKTLR